MEQHVFLISLEIVEVLLPRRRAIGLIDYLAQSECSIWLRSSFVGVYSLTLCSPLFLAASIVNFIFADKLAKSKRIL